MAVLTVLTLGATLTSTTAGFGALFCHGAVLTAQSLQRLAMDGCCAMKQRVQASSGRS
jgi:hypothetical protein